MRWLIVVAILGGCDVVFRLDRLPEPDGPQPLVGRWTQVAAGDAHVCALDVDRHLWCWGRNANGELGRASSAVELTNLAPVGEATWTSVSTSSLTTCGIQTDGSGWCWGDNAFGQLATPGTSANAPIQLSGGTWRELSAGAMHTCGIREDGTLWCWGRNDYGQLGNGTRTIPTADMTVVAGGTGTWEHVAAGYFSTCATASDRSLWCWGANSFGELANGTASPVAQPNAAVAGTDSWRAISAGDGYACGITTNGRLRCWGFGGVGNLGDGTQNNRSSPTAVLIDDTDRNDWLTVIASLHHTCALNGAGTLYCWGNSGRGQVGVDGTFANTTPIEVVGPGPFVALGAGVANTCAVTAGHALYCNGADGWGQLGDGGTSTSTPTHVDGAWQAVSLGNLHTCAIDMTGAAHCTGDNSAAQLGIGTLDSRDTFAPIGDTMWTAIAAGYRHSCGVKSGNVMCWGYNANGALGTGDTTARTTPVMIRAGTTVVASQHTCAVDGSGQLSCWGLNDQGQIGNGSTTDQLTPYTFTGITLGSIGVGISHSCAMTTSSGGLVGCWGLNDSGQLGHGDTTNTTSPVPLVPQQIAAQVAIGGFHSCLTATSGSAACWGANGFGQLGVGDSTNRMSATAIPGTWRSLSLGTYHSCGIRLDGTLWCWGSNGRGQLGDGSHTQRTLPVQVDTAHDWRSVAAGWLSTCAIKIDNSLWCWGDNDSGQLALPAWRAELIQVP